MKRRSGEDGIALVMLIGITSCLAILAMCLALLTINQIGASARETKTRTSLDYAEAGLNSAVNAAKTLVVNTFDAQAPATPWWSTTATMDTSTFNAEYATEYPGGPTVTYRLYDDASAVGPSTPQYDANVDNMVWVEASVTYRGRTSVVRQEIRMDHNVSIVPTAPLYCDTDMQLNGTSDAYMVNNDGTPYTFTPPAPPPYATTIMCGGNLTANSSTDLAAPADATHKQSLGLQVDGTVSTPGHTFNRTAGDVGMLSDYFDQAHQVLLTQEAQQAIDPSNYGQPSPTYFNKSVTMYSDLSGLQSAMSPSGSTYTASVDLGYTGNLTLNAAGTTYNFKKLYVSGNLLVTGSTTTLNCTGLYVTGNLIISGPATTNRLGALFVGGYCAWDGASGGTTSIQTTTLADPNTALPMYAQILCVDSNTTFNASGTNTGGDNSRYDSSTGAYSLVLGDVWVEGNAGTSDVAVNFSGPPGTASTVMCDLLATTEKTVSNGKVNVGSLASPTVYYMQCDNDNAYTNTCDWASTGTFTGLMILFEAQISITNGTAATPTVVGAVMDGTPVATDITLSGGSSVSYNQAVIENLPSSLQQHLTTTKAFTVPGTWQQVSPQ